MRSTRNAVVGLLLAALTLAGCTGDAGGAGTDDEPIVQDEDFQDLDLKADESTGILRGVVIDEAIRPIASALVVVLVPGEANRTQTTRDDGLFGFDKLAPGEYFLQVSAPGYLAVQSSAKVVAGVANPDPVKVQLPVDPVSQPYVQPFHMTAFMECSVRPMFIGAQCSLPGGEDSVVNAEYDLTTVRPRWIQSEMMWESSQAIGDELSLAIRCHPGERDPSGKCPDGVANIVRAEGVSPQVAIVNETLMEAWALGGDGGNPLIINLFAFGRSDLDAWNEETIDSTQKPVTGNDCMQWGLVGQAAFGFDPASCMRLTGPGFVLNQKIDVYTHVFYGFAPPEGWAFHNGVPVPSPP